MKKYALLLRLNPNHWPVWQQRLKTDAFESIWFRTGRRIPSEIKKEITVFVLGTGGLGLVAYGKTSSEVKRIADPDYKKAPPEKQEEYKLPENRVCTDIKRISIPLTEIKKYPALKELHTRRETTTWLTEEQHEISPMLVLSPISNFMNRNVLAIHKGSAKRHSRGRDTMSTTQTSDHILKGIF